MKTTFVSLLVVPSNQFLQLPKTAIKFLKAVVNRFCTLFTSHESVNIEFVTSRYILHCPSKVHRNIFHTNQTHICVHPGFLLEVNFAFCACVYLSFFYAIIDFSCSCFFWYARDANFSHMYTELKTAFVKQYKDLYLRRGGGGQCHI